MSYLPTTGVPKLQKIQGKMKRLKKAKTAGIQVTSLLELKQFMTPLLMPPTMSALTAATSGVVQAVGSSNAAGMRMVYVPLPLTYDTEGACVTGPAQIKWMGQLLNMPLKFVLHADGKHKLHHGKWLLITLGTHYLRWDEHHLTLSTSFAPLMYLFCKQQETLGAAKMLIDAVQTTCKHYFGKTLEPGAMMSDRSESFRAAFTAYADCGTFGQCWPHITRKFAQGEYCKQTWAHFEEAQAHIQTIHLAGSSPMKEMLIREIGLVWDKWGGKQMDTFWNSYCVSPWDCWSIGDFNCMLCTPSQNTQESWHKHLHTIRVPALFRASTEYVFAEGLPQLIELDGIALPKVLNFDVPCIPEGKMKKALWYVEHQATHILIKPDVLPDEFVYYILRKDNPLKVTRITKALVGQYESALEGIKDARCKHIESLINVCNSFHFVCEAREEYGVPDCEGNPALLDCPTCKAFKGVGICSHVLAINHILKQFNVRYQLATIGKRTDKSKKGPSKKITPALERIPQREPDSSDEEEERALLLGGQGK
jgi:hypothetical protein